MYKHGQTNFVTSIQYCINKFIHMHKEKQGAIETFLVQEKYFLKF